MSGEVAEWSKAVDSKSTERLACSVSSNLTFSAKVMILFVQKYPVKSITPDYYRGFYFVLLRYSPDTCTNIQVHTIYLGTYDGTYTKNDQVMYRSGVKPVIVKTMNDMQVRNLRPAKRQYRKCVDKNLYIEVYPSRNKSWSYRVRGKPGEKDAILGLGRYPANTTEQARALSRELRKR